jgi:adenylate cyclase
VRSAATSHVLRTIKDSSCWVLPSISPPWILIVDDDPDFVEITRIALNAEGFEVLSASSGEEALASMRVYTPHLVIMDIMMCGVLDGLQAAREMRADSALQDVPILMVSSITDSAFAGLLPKEEALPADNFLVKPIDTSLLISETKRLLRSRPT